MLKVSGQFALKEEVTDDDRKVLIGQNGTAMLYPYVRSIISMITSLDNNNVAVLPTLNFVELFNSENGNDE
ncbi:protein-export chaperone SecB [Limosilactobacillus pontis]|uniref:protein-export chaperone SecB n=1 Tax=Limosilactobacillus pontis TaxID=35787 RepID=UPI00241E10D9|nr:protein-export chaperone SecB [Limosilactobacillus pontis]